MNQVLTYADVVSSNKLSKNLTEFFTDIKRKLNVVTAKKYAEIKKKIIEKIF